MNLRALIFAMLVIACAEEPEREPPRPREEWTLPPPPEPPLRIADAHYECGYVLSDDARYRLGQQCIADGGDPAFGARIVECVSGDAFGSPLWRVRAPEIPSAASSHLGYVKLFTSGWHALQ